MHCLAMVQVVLTSFLTLTSLNTHKYFAADMLFRVRSLPYVLYVVDLLKSVTKFHTSKTTLEGRLLSKSAIGIILCLPSVIGAPFMPVNTSERRPESTCYRFRNFVETMISFDQGHRIVANRRRRIIITTAHQLEFHLSLSQNSFLH